MADVSITATSVLKGATAVTNSGTAGGAVTAGQPIYSDSSDGKKLKSADADAEASAEAIGIALHAAENGQPLVYAISGIVGLGAVMTQGEVYVVSATAGGIAPQSDLVSGDYVTVLGVAASTSNLDLSIEASGAAKP